MPLEILIEPIVEIVVSGAAEAVAEIAGQVFGEAVVARLPVFKKSYSEAYCKSFFCLRCPGMAPGRLTRRGWYLFRCRDCGSRWGVLKSKPWLRREARARRASTQLLNTRS